MSYNLAHIPCKPHLVKYQVDTPLLPQAMQDGAKCYFLLFDLSHTLIVVVQWPKFVYSTTLNTKGYKACKETGHVSYVILPHTLTAVRGVK